jgi:hypothetical protein
MQKEAIVQKTKINEAFDKMKCKGKMDPNIMEKLGITSSSSPVRPSTNNPRESVRSQSPPYKSKALQGSVRTTGLKSSINTAGPSMKVSNDYTKPDQMRQTQPPRVNQSQNFT